jgi:NADH:ubiquinone oxidoreductase subunit 2 (subunit N)
MTGIIGCLVVLSVLHLITPFWWWVMAVPFLYGLVFGRSARRSFRTGALSAGLLWLGAAIYFHFTGSALIARRVAMMMKLGSSWLMVAVAGLLAGLAAGFAGLAGYSIRALFRRRR